MRVPLDQNGKFPDMISQISKREWNVIDILSWRTEKHMCRPVPMAEMFVLHCLMTKGQIHTKEWLSKFPMNSVCTQELLKILCIATQSSQAAWGAVVAEAVAAAIAVPQIVAADRAWASDGCERMWGHDTELPLCVSPDSRRMTRLCCSCDKDKLQSLEDVSMFFFFHPPYFLSLSLCLSSSFNFVGTGSTPNVSHTKRGKNILGVQFWPFNT